MGGRGREKEGRRGYSETPPRPPALVIVPCSVLCGASSQPAEGEGEGGRASSGARIIIEIDGHHRRRPQLPPGHKHAGAAISRA